MRRVLVVGGGGFLGRRVVEELTARGFAVSVGQPVDGADVVVNCADSIAAPPDAAIARVLEKGGMWIDAGADEGLVNRLIRESRRRVKGSVVVGMGLFPGISNLMAREVGDVVVRVDPFSGAGKGTVRLMGEALMGGRPAEVAMLEASGVKARVRYAVGFLPAWLMDGVGKVARRCPRWMVWPFASAATAMLYLVRTVLLRRRSARIRIEAEGLVLTARDGFGAAAAALAAACEILCASPPPPGMWMPDEVMRLADVLAAMPGRVELQGNRSARSRSSAMSRRGLGDT